MSQSKHGTPIDHRVDSIEEGTLFDDMNEVTREGLTSNDICSSTSRMTLPPILVLALLGAHLEPASCSLSVVFVLCA